MTRRVATLVPTCAVLMVLGLVGGHAMAVDMKLIVDDADPGFTSKGPWRSADNGGADYGGSCLWTQCEPGGRAAATWRAQLPEDGTYGVYVLLAQATLSARNPRARYTIAHADGEDVVDKDQRSQYVWGRHGDLNKKWQLLGRYDFTSDKAARVTLSNEGPADTVVVADAVMFLRQPSDEPVGPEYVERSANSYVFKEATLDIGPIRLVSQMGQTWVRVLVPGTDGDTWQLAHWGLPECVYSGKGFLMYGHPGGDASKLVFKVEGMPGWRSDNKAGLFWYDWDIGGKCKLSTHVVRLTDTKGTFRLSVTNTATESIRSPGIQVCMWQEHPRGDFVAERTFVLTPGDPPEWTPVKDLPPSSKGIEGKDNWWCKHRFAVGSVPDVNREYYSPAPVAAPVLMLVEPDRRFAVVYGFRNALAVGSVPEHPCMHMTLRFADCAPGETVTMAGMFWVVPSDETEALIPEIMSELMQ